MAEKTLLHPERDDLVAFGLGKLQPDEATKIETHLEECEACCETLLDLKDDTFVELVRKSPEPAESTNQAGHDPAAGLTEPTDGVATDEAVSAATMLVESGDSAGPDDLPTQLQDHARYRIIELIGKGGMGDVYKAEHRLMDRLVALKLINQGLVRNTQAVERFRREVRAAARLTHPNIVTAYDAEQAGDVHFLVMEFVDGTDLASVVQQQGPLPIAQACDCIRQAAEGLQHAHEMGMVHRDIKPHNLMLSSRGLRVESPERGNNVANSASGPSVVDSRPTVKILDFGLAGFAAESALVEADSVGGADGDTTPLHLTTFGSVMGTPDYIAPEQARDAHSADIRADIYSLGCTLYFLLSGQTPHTADSVVDKLKAHAEREPEAIETVCVDVPDELAEVIRRMMAKDSADRFQSPAEVADALAPFVDQHRSDGDDGRGGPDNSLPTAIAEPMRFGHRVLSIAGILSVVAAILAISNRGWIAFQYPEWLAPWLRLGGMASLPVGLLVLFGAVRMKRPSSYGLVVSGVLVSMLPLNPAAIAMLPLTAWLLLLLRRPEIRAAFQPDGLASLPASVNHRPRLRLAGLVLSSVIGTGVLGAIIHFDTDHGELTIEVDDPSLVVRIERDGRLMRIEDEGGIRVTFLPSGEYDIKVPGADDTVSISPNRVQISRGGKKFITIRRAKATAQLSDQQRIQGTWIAESGERGGQSMPREQIGMQRAVFNGDKLTVLMPAGLAGEDGQTGEGVFELKTAKDPKEIWLQVKGQSGGMRGIYKLKGDRLTLCMNQDRKGKLPTEFVSPAGTMVDLIVLRQVSRPPALSPEFLKEYDLVIRLGRGLLSDKERQKLVSERRYIAEAMAEEMTRGPIEMFASLPDSAHSELKRKGYVKWRFADVPASHQQVYRRQFKWWVQKGKWSPDMINDSEVGFATVKLLTSTVVSAFVLYPNGSSEMWSTVVGTLPYADNDSTAAHPPQIKALRNKPLSTLPDSFRDSGSHPPTPFEALLSRQNKQIKGNMLPFVVFARNGQAAFRFGKWLLVFEGVPCQADPQSAGLLGVGGFNYPIRGGKGTIGESTFGDQVTFRGKWDSKASEITVADKYTFKLLGKGDRLEFDDRTYSATNGVQTIVIANDGSTQLMKDTTPQDSSVSDHDRLQGKWVPVSGHMRTKAMTAEQLTNMSVTFEGNRVALTDPDSGRPIPSGTFTVDADRDPNHITMTAPDGSETLPGIFQFDGDRLRLAWVDEDYARPTDFSPSDTADHMTLVLEQAPLAGPAPGETERDVLKAANEFLAVMDAGTFGQLYDMCASWAKRQTTRGKTSQTHQKIRDSFGKAVQRTLYRAHQIDQDPNLPKGRYAVVLYKSRFERQPELWETLVLNVDTDGQWRVITYAWTLEPPTLPAPKTNDAPATTQKKQAALTAAQQWLKLVDTGEYGDAWDACAELTRKADDKQTLVNAYNELFKPLGKLKSRDLKTNEYKTQLPRAPVGEYAVIQFSTQFTGGRVTETVVLTREADGHWRVSGYFHAEEKNVPTPPPLGANQNPPQRKTGILTNPPSVPTGGLPTGKNLIADSSLEDTPLGSLPKTWSAWLDDGPDFKCEVVEGGVTGKHCLQISGKGTRGVVFCTSVPMDRTKRYALKGRVKLEGDSTSWAVIKINYFNKSGWLGVDDRIGVSSKQSGWQFFEKTDRADVFPEATLMVPTCHIEGNGTAWFDDLELVAYDRDTLPADFEAKHGKNNRLAAPFDFDRWVGRWEYQITDSSKSTINATVDVRRILGDRFLLWHWTSDTHDVESIALLGFDEHIGAYHHWYFDSKGAVHERTGQWNSKTDTLTLHLKPSVPGITGTSDDRFVGNDRIESTLSSKNSDGQTTGEMRATWIRKSDTVDKDIALSTGPAIKSEEFAILQKFVDNWSIKQTMKPSIWFPDGDTDTFTEHTAWAIGGRFLMFRSHDEKQHMNTLALMTYEPKEKSYHYWYFASDVAGGQWRITWDASSRGFHWRSIDMPSGWIGTGFNRWIDDDTFDNQALIKDKQGRVLLDSQQEKKRVR